jgi:PEGA domain-containing protein
VIQLTVEAGAEVSRFVELPAAPAVTGQVQIFTEPSGARVIVDGVPQGITPMTVLALAPGQHTVTVESGLANMSQFVTVEAGVTLSLTIPLVIAPIEAAAGWVSVTAPFTMDLYEQGRMLGNSGIDRIMLPAGRHDIEIVNEPLGFREKRTLQVKPGKLSVIGIKLPNGTASINAIPWANVSIDGQSVGETPIGNLSLSIGPHEVVFSNPKFGEQRRVIQVTEHEPVRFSIDMTKR